MRPESLFFLFSPVTRIKGVGSALSATLQRLLPAATVVSGASLPIVRDLLFHLPVGLVDRRTTYPLVSAPDGVIATFTVTVEAHMPPPPGRQRFKKPYKVVCGNETGDIALVFFNARDDYIKQMLPVGKQRVISGRVEHFEHRLQMPHPDIITTPDKLHEVQSLEPVYPLTVGLSSRRIATIVAQALANVPTLPEWIDLKSPPPFDVEILPWKEAILAAHHPKSEEELSPLSPARLRLAYDEMLANQLHLAMKRRATQHKNGIVITAKGALCTELEQKLPYKLTAGQRAVLVDIFADMASGRRMGRLLQGDVGSGKTIVALLAMLQVVEAGKQAALMVPTEIIASQHYEVISELVKLLPEKNLSVVLLTGSVKGKQREQVMADIASGKANIIIGTHALFQDQVVFDELALVVVDEQHRFGVNQRMALSAKGDSPHILHMTATPIPRSLTLTMYGDMDASLLTEKPAGRQPITTRIIAASRYGDVIERLQAALSRGEKAYWICPLVEEGENHDWQDDIAAATLRHKEFTARFGPIVGLVHGRMKSEERDREMHQFATGEKKLLVATTVVEVGVDVRDATIMVIEKAERFGLSQLHQLRGRVGRGDKPSACVLLYSDVVSEVAQQRLSVLRETEDGFRIAEVDLAIRGGGDVLGTRQSGLPRFIFTDLLQHQTLLEHARHDVAAYIESDPKLNDTRGQALQILLSLFGYQTES